jgi:LysR family transcriptional activator of nhaA
VVCREDKTDRLLADLANQGLDLVLADAPISGASRVRAYNHLLGECTVSFLAAPELAKQVRHGFPASLDGAPMLLPSDNTVLRRALDQWFEKLKVRPKLVAEFDDSALMKVFAQHGAGVCPAPSVVAQQVQKAYGLRMVGETSEVVERFYAITVERRIRHPAVAAISEAARQTLFG